jgi:hypothetical protein
MPLLLYPQARHLLPTAEEGLDWPQGQLTKDRSLLWLSYKMTLKIKYSEKNCVSNSTHITEVLVWSLFKL